MEQHGASWSSMELHGAAWSSMALHGAAWISMDQHGVAWSSMEQQGVSWSRMEQHRAARSSMKQHGVSKNMDYHHRQLGNGYVHSSMNIQQQTISLLLFHKLYFSFVFLMLSFSIKNAPSSHSQHYFSLSSV